MNYLEAVDYLDSLTGLGSDLGLERISSLMEKLGNPQEEMKIIHVAGTNGKGSTCAMLSGILIEAGYQVGVYTSPHLENYNERYTINHNRISDEDFGEMMTLVKEKCDELIQDGTGQPTVFEVVTAVGFLYFARKKVDFLLLEVGLGGRFDATNVIKKPMLSVITAIGMDHMDFLGNTIEAIAFEKGGIIKKNCPVVLYTQKESVYEVIKNIAEENNALLYYGKNQTIDIITQGIEGTIFNVENEYFSYKNLEISLLGVHQLHNGATALLACKALCNHGIMISEKALRDGLKKAQWSGRMEIIDQHPLTILDGAHNVDGIEMLAKALKDYFQHKRITLLIGFLGDKEYEKMIRLLLPLATKIVFTQPNNSRKWNTDTMAAIGNQLKVEVHCEGDIEKAFALAKKITGTEDVLCCSGSLYLIGEIYQLARR